MEGMEKLSFSARSPPEPHHHQASQVYSNVLAVITSMCRDEGRPHVIPDADQHATKVSCRLASLPAIPLMSRPAAHVPSLVTKTSELSRKRGVVIRRGPALLESNHVRPQRLDFRKGFPKVLHSCDVVST